MQSDPDFAYTRKQIGIVALRQTPADYDDDMQRAKALGIDAFALNIGTDEYTEKQLDLAYESAANNGMKCFISFDFNWFQVSDAAKVGRLIAKYASKPAQLKVGNKVFASSFAGDGFNVGAMKAAAGCDVFWAPNVHPSKSSNVNELDAAFNWMAWPSNGRNKAPDAGTKLTVQDGDELYLNWLGDKPYMAGVSPWFSTHFGPEVPYSKNWVFPGELLWYERWNDILALGPQYVEIITWNDYGESHYIGPLSSTHHDDGNSKWVNDMPHDGWLDMAAPFIAAYHAGATKVDDFVEEDQLIYWYRPNPKDLDCDGTDTTTSPANNASGNYFQGRPDGVNTVEDAVFVISLLTAPGVVTVTSGGNAPVTYNAPAGAHAHKVPMGVGQQTFELTRGGESVLSGTSLKDITDTCICGIYNFNSYVGTLPFRGFGSLDDMGLEKLTDGLKVDSCEAKPTLNGHAAGPAPTRKPYTRPATKPATAPTSAPTSTRKHRTTVTIATSTVTVYPSDAPTSSFASTEPTITSAPSLGPDEPEEEDTGSCNAGTAAPGLPDNFISLCEFACGQDYCPPGVCQCTSTGAPGFSVQGTQAPGCPLPHLNEGYKGLWAYSCARGFCPPDACQPNCGTAS